MNIKSYLPDFAQEEINPEKPDDYRDESGILHCGVCHKPKQFHIKVLGIDKIVPCICDCVKKQNDERRRKDEQEEEMRRIQRLKDGSLMPGKFRQASFELYTERKGNKAAHDAATAYCKKWPEMKKNNQGILFYGKVGTGKSYTAACIANYLLDQGIPVIMTSFVKILQDVRSAENEGEYIAILNTASLLIIDDLGAERNTDYALEKIYNVIDSRIRADKPLILTTNLDLQEMLNAEDIRYKRIYDRIFEVCYPVKVYGDSFRVVEAARRFEKMEQIIKER